MSAKEDIRNRTDIYKLVTQFYDKVKKDEQIGFFFNNTITDWDEHFTKLTDFWETNLLFVVRYKGNPVRAHQEVDKKHSSTPIEQKHFAKWLQLWFETIDELFEGATADTAKRRARKMSTFMFLKIYEDRTK